MTKAFWKSWGLSAKNMKRMWIKSHKYLVLYQVRFCQTCRGNLKIYLILLKSQDLYLVDISKYMEYNFVDFWIFLAGSTHVFCLLSSLTSFARKTSLLYFSLDCNSLWKSGNCHSFFVFVFSSITKNLLHCQWKYFINCLYWSARFLIIKIQKN